MLKALLKKQFAELGSVYAINKKTGKQRSKGASIGVIIALIFGALSCGVAFFGMGMLLGGSYIPKGLDWLYFAMFGAIAVFVSLVGEVFATYSMLYNAKDNELLLSMPIPSRTILLSRMSTLYVMSLIFAAIVFVPAMIAYYINGGAFTWPGLICCLVLLLVLALAALALACLLGWVVALIGSKIKGNKAVITSLVAVLLMGVYYMVYFRLNKILQSAAENADRIAEVMRAKLMPLYHVGLAATGKPLYLLFVTAGVAALFAVIWLLLSRNFLRLALADRSAGGAKLRGGEIKAGSADRALLGREFKHFTSSTAYLLNCGIGIVMLLAIGVIALVRAPVVRDTIAKMAENAPVLASAMPVAAAVIIMFTMGMNLITAPSVSLEGANIWILQTMPVDPARALNAKQRMHVLLNGAAAIIAGALICAALKLDIVDSLLVIVCTIAFIWLISALGLAVNIKKPSLDWTNETVPIKQGASVVITMFSGWGVAAVFGLFGFLAASAGAGALRVFFAVMTVVFLIAAYLITRWINTKGAKIFSQL